MHSDGGQRFAFAERATLECFFLQTLAANSKTLTKNPEILITEHSHKTLAQNPEVLITEHSEMAARAWNRIDLSHTRRILTNSVGIDQRSDMSFIT